MSNIKEINNIKRYLLSEDEYSGQVVIECKVVMTEVDTHIATEDELSAAQYLYREIPQELEIQPRYHVSAYYHYEDAFNRSQNCLFHEIGRTKEEGNELFRAAVQYMK